MKKVFGILTILMLLFTGCGNNSDSVKKLKLAHALTGDIQFIWQWLSLLKR